MNDVKLMYDSKLQKKQNCIFVLNKVKIADFFL